MENSNRKLYELSELMQENGGPLPLSRSAIYYAVSTGDIPSIRLGRRVFVPSWFIDSLLNPPAIQGA